MPHFDNRMSNVRIGNVVHERYFRLGTSHVIPACEADRDIGWTLVIAEADRKRYRAASVREAAFTTKDAVTCRACKRAEVHVHGGC